MTNQPNTANKNTRDAFEMFKEHLSGADRVIVETKNAVGGMDATYLHAPAIQEAINARADLAPMVKPMEWEDWRLDCVAKSFDDTGIIYTITEVGVNEFHVRDNAKGYDCFSFRGSETECRNAAEKNRERRILSPIIMAPITPAQAAKVLLGDGFMNTPLLTELDPFNNCRDVHEDVTKALKAIAEEG